MARYQVASPALRKVDKLNPDTSTAPAEPLAHRFLSVYSATYRTVMGAWSRIFTEWLLQWLPAASYGGLPKRDIINAAWDVQSFLEEQSALGKDGVAILLDYSKFFDMFSPDIVHGMLTDLGFPLHFVALIIDLLLDLRRYIKIGDRFGEPEGQRDGMGQGDPFSVVVALIFVGLEQRVISRLYPCIKQTAVMDDRALRGPPPSRTQSSSNHL